MSVLSRRVGRLAVIVVTVTLLAVPAAVSADKIDDLLSELQLQPLGGQLAPPFTLPALDGKRVSLGDFKGQVVLLYFWTTW